MIELDDPRWPELSHAYGSAADLPELLRQLARATGPKIGYQSEPWFTLWSSLCHQGDVYDASYAALPHIVEIAVSAKEPIDFSFLQLPAAIEIARNSGNGPPVTECVAVHRHEDWDEPTLLSAVSALAAAKGHHRIAEAIMNLDDDLITKLVDLDFGNS